MDKNCSSLDSSLPGLADTLAYVAQEGLFAP